MRTPRGWAEAGSLLVNGNVINASDRIMHVRRRGDPGLTMRLRPGEAYGIMSWESPPFVRFGEAVRRLERRSRWARGS